MPPPHPKHGLGMARWPASQLCQWPSSFTASPEGTLGTGLAGLRAGERSPVARTSPWRGLRDLVSPAHPRQPAQIFLPYPQANSLPLPPPERGVAPHGPGHRIPWVRLPGGLGPVCPRNPVGLRLRMGRGGHREMQATVPCYPVQAWLGALEGPWGPWGGVRPQTHFQTRTPWSQDGCL